MGALADKARAQSNWLIIEKGGFAVVRFDEFRFVPSKNDPLKEIVQYVVSEDGKRKVWENASARIMMKMDKIKPGTFIKITKDKWINKDGSEAKDKSTYDVIELDSQGKPIIREEAPAIVGNPAGWDDDK